MTLQRLYSLWPWLWWALVLPLLILALAVVAAASTNREDLLFDRLDLWWVAGAVPLAGALYLYAMTRKRKSLELFASAKLAPLLVDRARPSRQALRAGLVVCALAFVAMAVIGPRWGVYVQKQQVFGRDIVVALDVSRSMLAADLEPNRFERAKREIRQQLTERGAFAQENRLALLAFAGSTSLRLPLTTDSVAFRNKLEQLQVGAVPQGGTAIGEAITAATELFAKSPMEAEKVILLFTDGEDHEGGPLEAAKAAYGEHGIRVFTVGVGDPARTIGAQVPSAAGSDRPLLHDGQIVFSKLNEEALGEIAAAGGGDYAPVQQLFRLVNRIGSMKKAELTAEQRMRHQPRYQWFVAAALMLLLLEALLGEAGLFPMTQPIRVWQQEAA